MPGGPARCSRAARSLPCPRGTRWVPETSKEIEAILGEGDTPRLTGDIEMSVCIHTLGSKYAGKPAEIHVFCIFPGPKWKTQNEKHAHLAVHTI